MPRKSDKRERLLKAARSLIHQQGFHQTTLADISEKSGVTLGNLYYYFKTKEEIVSAVVEKRTERFHALTREWEDDPDPKNRLIRFMEMPATICGSIADHGCPVGSLSQELNKSSGYSQELASKTLNAQLEWATAQFRLLGRKDAVSLGNQFIATLQGASLLANALNKPEVITEQIGRNTAWLEGL